MVSSAGELSTRALAQLVGTGDVLREHVDAAVKKADERTRAAIFHCKLGLCGLGILETLRAFAYWQGPLPIISDMGIHVLSALTDLLVLLAMTPFLLTGIYGQCVRQGYLGPILTMVFSMTLADAFGLLAYLLFMPSRPAMPSFVSTLERFEARYGVWEAILVASVATQLALLAALWRVYRDLRLLGLYPPGSVVVRHNKPVDVSVLEVLLDAEDIDTVRDCSTSGCCCGHPDGGPRVHMVTVEPSSAFVVAEVDDSGAAVPDVPEPCSHEDDVVLLDMKFKTLSEQVQSAPEVTPTP
eukprot:TRINITY_DN73853_c0_g1_i2.p1 TRINITY_DN73853_c0_g1~~TRINITY_DN73853_c0_g1_i2.p1  ORF type:complete len:298 (+),score=40.00 TRINITY_DN73853_c0_g1_i2:148-1041(+)